MYNFFLSLSSRKSLYHYNAWVIIPEFKKNICECIRSFDPVCVWMLSSWSMQKSTQKWSAHDEKRAIVCSNGSNFINCTVNEMSTDSNGMLNMFLSILILFCLYVPMSLSNIKFIGLWSCRLLIVFISFKIELVAMLIAHSHRSLMKFGFS